MAEPQIKLFDYRLSQVLFYHARAPFCHPERIVSSRAHCVIPSALCHPERSEGSRLIHGFPPSRIAVRGNLGRRPESRSAQAKASEASRQPG